LGIGLPGCRGVKPGKEGNRWEEKTPKTHDMENLYNLNKYEDERRCIEIDNYLLIQCGDLFPSSLSSSSQQNWLQLGMCLVIRRLSAERSLGADHASAS